MELAFIVVFLFISGSHAQFEISMMLKDVTVLEGQDAVIPCDYDAPDTDVVPTIKWSTQDSEGQRVRVYTFKKGGDSNPYPAADRVFSIGDNGELQIPGATIEDDKNIAALVCEVDYETLTSKEGELQFNVVALADEEPEVTTLATEFEAGSGAVNIGTCMSGKAYPPPKITFYRENEPLNDGANDDFSDFTNDKLEIGEGDKRAVSMTLTRVVTKEDDQAKFYCVVTSGGGDSPDTMLVQNTTFDTFRVRYPTDTVTIVADKEEAFVGKELKLTCEANGYPDAVIDFEGGTDATIMMTVEKVNNGQVFGCAARNNPDLEAVSASNYVINALYADDPTIKGNTQLNYGELLSLSCSGDSNPPSVKTVWKKDGAVLVESAQYTVEEVNFEHAGVYTCEIENPYDQLNKMVESSAVTVNGLMLESPKDENVKGELKKTVPLVCSAMSSPKPSFAWTKKSDGSTVEGAELTMDGDNKYISTLTVGPLDATMSKEAYVCAVSNGESTSVVKTFMLPEMEPEAASPTAGIIIGILVAILVVAIVVAVLYNKGIICKKGEAKGDEDAEDIQPVKVAKEDAEPVTGRPDDVEAGHTEANVEPSEDTQLMKNGNGDQ